jgi:DNA repair exonuclease SbcCD nuclease subunit
MIDKIIHLADIHIRYGDEDTSRYEEYMEVFDNLEKELGKI